MMTTSRLMVLMCMAWIAPQLVYSQETTLLDIRSVADSVYGLNDLLINGRMYSNAHRKANGHPYFPEETFSPGAVFIKGEKFDHILVNYDAVLDELVLEARESLPWGKYLILNNKLVDSFLIGDRRFVQANTLPVNTAGRKYLEKVFEGQFSLFATHQKNFKSEYSQFNPNGIFLASPATYLILDNGSFYEVTRKEQWLDYFIDHKKELKNYLHKHKINLRKANFEQLKQVAAFCNGFYR